MRQLINTATLAALSLGSGGCGSLLYQGQHPSVGYDPVQSQISERVRSGVHTVTVVSDGREPTLSVSGDYGREVTGTGEGAAEGAAFGAQTTADMVAEDPRAVLLVPFILPAAMITGSIAGATAAKIEQQIQKFRERLADELAASEDRSLPGDRLAQDVTEYLDAGDYVESVPVDADAVLTVSVVRIEVIMIDEDANIVTTVGATLRDSGSGAILYSNSFQYGKRDSLRRWTADDGAAWGPYAEIGRRYLAAEIAADLFERIRVRHVLRPASTTTFSGDWEDRVSTQTPTLGWELFVLDDSTEAGELGSAGVTWELRIYDAGRVVYRATDIVGTSHTVTEPLGECRRLHWSVRPVYRFDDRTRAGTWMNNASPTETWKSGIFTERTEYPPDFWKYYAEIATGCRS